jgi:hypothetical protein
MIPGEAGWSEAMLGLALAPPLAVSGWQFWMAAPESLR